MKVFTSILLGGLFLLQPVFSSSLILSVDKANSVASGKKKKWPANIHLLHRESVTRSFLPPIPGYIEDGRLYIHFEESIENRYLRVTDTDSGNVIYCDYFSGDTLVIPLTVAGNNYSVEFL